VVEKNFADIQTDPPTPLTISVASPGSAVPPLVGGPLLSQATPCYWNINNKTTRPSNEIPLAGDFPAMEVMVSKTTEQNEGPVKRYLAPVLNIIPNVFIGAEYFFIEPTVDVSATSVAVIVPKGVKGREDGAPGSLKPMVATKVIVDKYWNMYGSSGEPFQFKIGDGKTAEDTMWTTFKVVDNSNDYTKDLILQGNPTPLFIGDSIHLQPGVRAVDYGPNEMGNFQGQTVVLPIVDPATLVANTDAPIIGFIAFRITGYSQGGKYIEGYFDKDYVITNPQGITIPQGINPPPFFQLVY
jgi:hypothetical protein